MAARPEVAKLLDITERRVSQLVKDGTIPRPNNGDYNLSACVIAYIRFLRKENQGGGSASLTDERARLAKMQADKVEHDLKVARGEFIPVKGAAWAWGKVIQQARARLLALPVKGAPLLIGKKSLPEVKETLDALICDALNELTNPDLTGITDQTDGEAVEPD